jgi:hypothetical protein
VFEIIEHIPPEDIGKIKGRDLRASKLKKPVGFIGGVVK